MELRAARAAARRRVSAYTTTVSMAGLTLLVLAAPAAARVAGRDPEPLLLLAALVLAAELMPLKLGRPGGPGGVRAGDSTTMSQPFPFALVLGWGTPAGVVALGACSALADLLAGKAARKVLFNSAQLATALGAAGLAYSLAGGHPGSPGDHPGGPPDPSRSTGGPPRRSPGPPPIHRGTTPAVPRTPPGQAMCRCPPSRPPRLPSSWSTTCWWRRCWCWQGARRHLAGSARGWACGPGCRPCCWGWPRWSR